MFSKLFVLCVVVAVAHGYSSGAPVDPEVCETLTPKHPASPQKRGSPYRIELDKTVVVPLENVGVTISSDADAFKGFIIQGRKEGENAPQGKFLTGKNPDVQSLSCGSDGSTVTHTSSTDKYNINLQWQAPREPGKYVILTTFVQSGKVFWVALPSPTISVVKG
ncbi:unnamed protein product [Allacma fusca]|uniref:Reelin domain-containing protein n=1 Tax=Allacma fusca TaxID=39272 RepID=A0A8J2KI89_9HEXA|nr:unnamed protein product [Allacma fusca]